MPNVSDPKQTENDKAKASAAAADATPNKAPASAADKAGALTTKDLARMTREAKAQIKTDGADPEAVLSPILDAHQKLIKAAGKDGSADADWAQAHLTQLRKTYRL